jgi:hypothetical protein
VTISPRLARSATARRVTVLLDTYFAAINQRDYTRYSQLFGRWHQLARRTFRRGYASTRDSRATLLSVVPRGGKVIATVTFQSRQVPTASPDRAACDVWTITLYLRWLGHRYLITPPPAHYRARYRACH